MLTQHNYKNIDPNWDQNVILECCKKQPTEDKCSDCCYDSWQAELKKIEPVYNHVLEYSTQLQNRVTFITDRRDKYKAWIDELDNAEKLAREICYQLELIAVQSDKIWYNSCKATDAIEILFCMIRDILMQIDKIKAIYDSLYNCITTNNDPSLVPGQGILKYLDDYKQKLDATIKTRDDIIKNIIEAIKISNLIRNNISTKDCPAPDDKCYDPCAPNLKPCLSLNGVAYYGFKTIICEWYNAFTCDVGCNDVQNQANTSQQKQSGGTTTQPCKDNECELKPTFDFPICNNSFKNEVKCWLDKDNKDLVTLTNELNKAKKQKESLLACKSSLDKAILAVDPKQRCK